MNRVLAALAAPALAMLTSYKLIADSENQNKTCDKALGGIYSHVIETKVYKIEF